jgi:hypothetical protein
MDANKSQQLIDDFVRGKLSASDKIELDAMLSGNKQMQDELELQSDIVSQIKEARKLALKNRLRSIDTTNFDRKNNWMKYAAALILSAGALVTVYYFANKNTANVVDSEKLLSKNSINPTTIETPVLQTPSPNTPQIEKEPDQIIAPKPLAQAKEKTNSNINLDFDVTEKNTDVQIDESIKTETQSNSLQSTKNELLVSIDSEHKSMFHYKYFNSKLYLLCDFENQPYEIIETSNQANQLLYLYFNQNYYELKPNQTEVKALKAIKNSNLIKILDSMRQVK